MTKQTSTAAAGAAVEGRQKVGAVEECHPEVVVEEEQSQVVGEAGFQHCHHSSGREVQVQEEGQPELPGRHNHTRSYQEERHPAQHYDRSHSRSHRRHWRQTPPKERPHQRRFRSRQRCKNLGQHLQR